MLWQVELRYVRSVYLWNGTAPMTVSNGVRRVVDGVYFADVPNTAPAHLDEVIEDTSTTSSGDHVQLRGTVLHHDVHGTVVSCGGLLARIPQRPEHTLQSAVCVIVRQRAQAA